MKKILMIFQDHSENGGPFNSQKRIIESNLSQEYDFNSLYIPRIRVLLRPSKSLGIMREIRKINPDIIHFSGLQLEGFIILLLIKLSSKAPSVCAIRGSSKDAVFFNALFRTIIVQCEKWTLKHCDVVYGVSDYVTNWSNVKRYSNRLFGTIYNFYDFSANSFSKNEVLEKRKECGIEEHAIVITYTGRVTEEKGCGDLYRVIERINAQKSHDNIYFMIVGDGNYRKRIEQSIIENGYNNVILTGYVKDVGAYLDISDIFISCTWHETFGNSIIEASFHELPVVATRTGGIQEIVCDGKTGRLIEKGDIDGFVCALEELISKSEYRQMVGRSGKKYVMDKFNELGIEEKLRKLYEET